MLQQNSKGSPPTSQDSSGDQEERKQYFLIATDYVTKLLKIYTISNHGPVTVMGILITNFLCCFRAPQGNAVTKAKTL
jgi:hypothetical protein